jgi:hypothetical protein
MSTVSRKQVVCSEIRSSILPFRRCACMKSGNVSSRQWKERWKRATWEECRHIILEAGSPAKLMCRERRLLPPLRLASHAHLSFGTLPSCQHHEYNLCR